MNPIAIWRRARGPRRRSRAPGPSGCRARGRAVVRGTGGSRPTGPDRAAISPTVRDTSDPTSPPVPKAVANWWPCACTSPLTPSACTSIADAERVQFAGDLLEPRQCARSPSRSWSSCLPARGARRRGAARAGSVRRPREALRQIGGGSAVASRLGEVDEVHGDDALDLTDLLVEVQPGDELRDVGHAFGIVTVTVSRTSAARGDD